MITVATQLFSRQSLIYSLSPEQVHSHIQCTRYESYKNFLSSFQRNIRTLYNKCLNLNDTYSDKGDFKKHILDQINNPDIRNSFQDKYDQCYPLENFCKVCEQSQRFLEPDIYICDLCDHRLNGSIYMTMDKLKHYCKKCWQIVNPSLQYIKITAPVTDDEIWVACSICASRYHTICVLSTSDIIVCPYCVMQYPDRFEMIRNHNNITNLRETMASKHMQQYIQKLPVSDLVIRELFCNVSNHFVDPDITLYFQNNLIEYPTSVLCRTRCFVLFQTYQGVDIMIFMIYLFEYDDKVESNRHKIYISYLDSCEWINTTYNRSDIFHHVILGYLDFSRNKYISVHLWMSPPFKNDDDYIFHIHNPHRKRLSVSELRNWYAALFEKALERNILKKLENIPLVYYDDGMIQCSRMPYFEGDCWILVLKGILESNEKVIPAFDKGMRKNRSDFYVAYFNSDQTESIEREEPILNTIFSKRTYFINFCKGSNLEFDQLRKCKYNTFYILQNGFINFMV